MGEGWEPRVGAPQEPQELLARGELEPGAVTENAPWSSQADGVRHGAQVASMHVSSATGRPTQLPRNKSHRNSVDDARQGGRTRGHAKSNVGTPKSGSIPRSTADVLQDISELVEFSANGEELREVRESCDEWREY